MVLVGLRWHCVELHRPNQMLQLTAAIFRLFERQSENNSFRLEVEK